MCDGQICQRGFERSELCAAVFCKNLIDALITQSGVDVDQIACLWTILKAFGF
jgi:hypothetical protein